MALFDKQHGQNETLLPAVRLQFVGDNGQQYYENANERQWTWDNAKNEVLTNEVLRKWTWASCTNESIRKWTWDSIRKESIAYSVRLEDMVIADYDCDGTVRGIEFLGGQHGPIDFYVKLAVQKSRGPTNYGFGTCSPQLFGLATPQI